MKWCWGISRRSFAKSMAFNDPLRGLAPRYTLCALWSRFPATVRKVCGFIHAGKMQANGVYWCWVICCAKFGRAVRPAISFDIDCDRGIFLMHAFVGGEVEIASVDCAFDHPCGGGDS